MDRTAIVGFIVVAIGTGAKAYCLREARRRMHPLHILTVHPHEIAEERRRIRFKCRTRHSRFESQKILFVRPPVVSPSDVPEKPDECGPSFERFREDVTDRGEHVRCGRLAGMMTA